MMKMALLIWGLPSIVMTVLLIIDHFFLEYEKEKDGKEKKLTAFDNALFYIIAYMPIAQWAVLFGGGYEMTKSFSEKRQKAKKEVTSFQEKMNVLYECGYCGFIQRQHQLQADNYTRCCEEGHRHTMVKIHNSDIYQYALESGLTPEMNRKRAIAIMQEENKSKKEKQEKARKERENKEKMQNLLEKTKFIQKQNDIFLKKEQDKLAKMNEEIEQRREGVLQVLRGEQKEEFIKTINLFDELHAIELKKLEDFKKTSEEKISSLQQKIHA